MGDGLETGLLGAVDGAHSTGGQLPRAGDAHDDGDDDDARRPLCALLADEARQQAALTLPLAATLLTRFMQGCVDLAVVGRLLGGTPLAGASLALTLQFSTLGVVTMGFGDAVATLCSQALGAGQPQLCGLWLQAGMAYSTAAVLLVLLPLWCFAGPLLQAVAGVDATTASFASTYARVAAPRALIHANYYCFKVYLAAQRRLAPDVAGCVAGLAAAALLDVLLVGGTCALTGGSSSSASSPCWGGLGFVGAPLAAVAARAITAGLVVGLARLPAFGAPAPVAAAAPEAETTPPRKAVATEDDATSYKSPTPLPPTTTLVWTGWALHAGDGGALRADRRAAYLAVALPAALRSLADQGAVAGLALMAATLGPAAAAAHNVAVEVYACVGGAVCWAACDAVLVRVGAAMGSGRPRRAAAALAVGVAGGAAFAATVPPAVLLLPPRDALGRLFTDDDAVLAVVHATLPAMAALIAVTAIVFPLLGAAIGAGKARAGSRSWLAGVLAILPAAWGWGLAGGGGVPGLWGAWTAGYALAAACLAGVLARADWHALAAAATAQQHDAAATAATVDADAAGTAAAQDVLSQTTT